MRNVTRFNLGLLIFALYASLFTQVYAVVWREDVSEVEVLKKAEPFSSVVWVEAKEGHGSGVLIGPRTVLTAAHVAEGCKPFTSTVIAHDATGAEARYPILSIYFPESLMCTASSEGIDDWPPTHEDIAILELLGPVDTSRFNLSHLVGEFEDSRDLTLLFKNDYFLEFEGAGYGSWGAWGVAPEYPDGQRRYYQSRGFYDYDLDPETGLPLLETLSFSEYSNLDDKESLLPLHGVCKPGDSGSPVFDPKTGIVFALCVNGAPFGFLADDSEHNEMSGYVSLYPHLRWILDTRSNIERMSSSYHPSSELLTYDLRHVVLDLLVGNLGVDEMERLKYLLQRISVNLNTPDSLGHYPLGMAIYNGNIALAQFLLQHGADPNHDNGSSFSWLELAVLTENWDLADLLRQYGALDRVFADVAGCIGQEDRESSMLDFLIQHGEHSLSDFVFSDPLALALLEGIESEDKFMARLLLKSGADWTREDYFNQAPLFGSIGIFDEVTVNFLLENGVDPNVPDSNGRLPLVQAVMGGCSPIVQALLENGADPNAEDAFGRTPLYVALMPEEDEEMDESLLELLLSYGASVDKGHHHSGGGDRLGAAQPLLVTALFDWESLGVAKWLLEHGVSLNAVDVETGENVLQSLQAIVAYYENVGDFRSYRLCRNMEDLLLGYGAMALQGNLAS